VLHLEHCFIWLKDLDTKKIGSKVFESFEMWCWKRIKKIKWPGKVTNEILEHIGERSKLLNGIVRWKVKWIDQF